MRRHHTLTKESVREYIFFIIKAIVFYGGLFIWLDIQESGGFAAMFQDHDKMLTKALMALARLAQLL